jgi:hypothetical protein
MAAVVGMVLRLLSMVGSGAVMAAIVGMILRM